MADARIDVAGLDELLERAGAALSTATTLDSTTTGASGADGLIEAHVSPGRLESLRLDPQVMRLGAAELAAEIQEAVNRAFDAAAEHSADAARAASEALSAEIRDLQNESMRSMSIFVTAINDVVARFEQRSA
ncbi:hypothetical protein ACTI_75220 [Actinoplanes sp. OR16]|uniref:hypothetical protein n=1 Tax=Actinoplanes sp. OR16 TaxID=946334 RepID=UPI000F6DD9DE|nr:hypothetical protein [Actinoplanes sp. OR16]BBH70837.1 hypothetical protein ACTI_75220 [Actinoplanes sp. OR16]